VLSTSDYLDDAFHESYEVLPDGRGFLFNRPRLPAQASAAPTVVEAENWFAAVRARTKR
jgi:hypothetical protein